jgi:putative transcriptional regulator
VIQRNIGQEMIDSLHEIKAGGGRRYRFTAPGEIRQIREGVGVSQANSARILGISLRTLQDREQGRRRPNPARSY